MSKLSDGEQRSLKRALRPLFGPQVDNWQMNEKVLELYGELLSKSRTCSEAMDLVPRPYTGFGAKAYIRRELKRIARAATGEKKGMYISCLKGAAYGMKNRFHMAASGL